MAGVTPFYKRFDKYKFVQNQQRWKIANYGVQYRKFTWLHSESFKFKLFKDFFTN